MLETGGGYTAKGGDKPPPKTVMRGGRQPTHGAPPTKRRRGTERAEGMAVSQILDMGMGPPVFPSPTSWGGK